MPINLMPETNGSSEMPGFDALSVGKPHELASPETTPASEQEQADQENAAPADQTPAHDSPAHDSTAGDSKPHSDKTVSETPAFGKHSSDVPAGAAHTDGAHTDGAHAGHDHHGGTYLASDSFVERLEKGKAYFLDPKHLFEHVQDATFFEVPKTLVADGRIELPRYSSSSLVRIGNQEILTGRITKFMVLEVAAAVLIFAVFYWLKNKVVSGARPTGRLWNMLEAVVVFIRDEIAKPAIGDHDARRFMPFLLTIFFFVLALNLFGMIPFLGSATGAIAVTAVLAVVTFAIVVGSGVKKMGVAEYLKSRAPHMDLPPALGMVLIPGIWLIEIFGLFVKHFVLAVRLFANMFAGHLVLAVFLGFIGVVSATWLVWGVAPVVMVAKLALSVLELFVAFLQAYVFTFLAALFIGEAQHAH